LTNLIIFFVYGFGITVGSLSIGCYIMRCIGLTITKDLLPIGLGCGLFLLTQLLSLTGIIGIYNSPVIYVLGSICLFSGIWGLLRGTIPWKNSVESDEIKTVPFNIDPIIIRIGLGVILTIILINCMSPETRHDPYDYHLNVPSIYLANSKIVEIPWHVFSYMPKNIEMLFGMALSINNDSLCKLTHFLFGCFCLLTVGIFVRRMASHPVQLLSVLFIVTLPLFGFLATSSYVDLGKSFWELVSLYALYHVWETQKDREKTIFFLVSGLFAGMAFGSKYTSYLIFAPPYTILFLITWLTQFRIRRFGILLFFGCSMVIPTSPWLLTNVIWTGNPLYPLFPFLFGMHIPPANEAYEFFRHHSPQLQDKSYWELLLYLWNRIYLLLLDGNNLLIIGIGAWVTYPWWKNIELAESMPKHVTIGLLIFLLSLPIFFFYADNVDGRFFFTVFCLLSIPSAFMFQNIKLYFARQSPLGRYFVLILILGLVANSISYRNKQIGDLHESLLPVITDDQRNEWLSERFSTYLTAWWANETLDKKSLVIGMGYPLRCHHIAKIKFGYIPWLEGIKENLTADELAQLLLNNGVTHIHKDIQFPNLSPHIDFSILDKNHLHRVYQYRSSVLFEIINPSPGTEKTQ
jgi:hypothetical protein